MFWSPGVRPASVAESVLIGMESDEFLIQEATSIAEVESWARESAAGREYEVHVVLRNAQSEGLSAALKEV